MGVGTSNIQRVTPTIQRRRKRRAGRWWMLVWRGGEATGAGQTRLGGQSPARRRLPTGAFWFTRAMLANGRCWVHHSGAHGRAPPRRRQAGTNSIFTLQPSARAALGHSFMDTLPTAQSQDKKYYRREKHKENKIHRVCQNYGRADVI